MKEYWYYKLINKSTGEEFYSKTDAPVSKEKLLSFYKLSDGYTVEQITKEEYES